MVFIDTDYIAVIVDLSILAELILVQVINDKDGPSSAGRTKAGLAIQRRISQCGFTQATFARELGKSQPWVSQSLLDDADRTLRRIAVDDQETFTRLLQLLDWDNATIRRETGALDGVLLPGEQLGTTARQEVELSPENFSGHRDILVYDMLSGGPGADGGTVIDTIAISDEFKGEHVAYEVQGDSMAPDIENGDRVVVKVQDYASPGNEIVCFVPDHGMLVKFLDRTTPAGEYVLTSYNPEYRPIWTSEITIYGVVVEVRKRRKVINGNHGTN